MLLGYSPVFQALLGTLFTWGLTAAGAGLVFVFSSGQASLVGCLGTALGSSVVFLVKNGKNQRKILDGSLGFAAGVMTAASYWSLLAPAIEMATASGHYGDEGQWSFVPVAVGFILGAFFVYGADAALPYFGITDPALAFALEVGPKVGKEKDDIMMNDSHEDIETSTIDLSLQSDHSDNSNTHRRRGGPSPHGEANELPLNNKSEMTDQRQISWRRILLLIIAITIHNIPEGLAVGVGFGAIGKSASSTFENARNLAIGIGIQNFPEGLAVSLPLRGSGMSVWRSFFFGQLSGMVEPIAGVLGAAAVIFAEPILPYSLAFAAGAMIYVVFDDIIPESQVCGNGKLASWGGIVGFVVMMSLDVGLG